MTKTILLVEDDEVLAKVLLKYFGDNDYSIIHASSLSAGQLILQDQVPDAIILDANLPDGSGFEMCRQLRKVFSGVVVMLTGRDSDNDKIVGLELGADDYLVKPSDPRVIEAHLLACLRRAKSEQQVPVIKNDLRFGDLIINKDAFGVQFKGLSIRLTTAEFKLLLFFADHPGEVLSRSDLSNALGAGSGDDQDRSIDMRVSRLRRKLISEEGIRTIRNSGYLFNPSGWE